MQISFFSQPPVVEGEKEVGIGVKSLSEKLSNDVACGDDYSPDFSSEHVAKASNGDAEEHDDDDVVSVVDGGGVGEVVEDSPKSSRVPGAVPSALPSPSLEAASSPEGTPLTARKLFATPDSAMKVGETELKKSIQKHSKILLYIR